jgi:polysaccharide pyruvyl transferase WcaK-like protein
MKKILIYEPSILSENVGDFIIMDAVKEHLYTIFPNDMFFSAITQDKMPERTYKLNELCDYSFVGGTNILSSRMRRQRPWRIKDTSYIHNLVLMGVGWADYQKTPDLYSRFLLKRLLHNDILHSVRDSYTEKMLISAGITNVINTGCPTMWNLTEDHCSKIPSKKADNVLFTLTDYSQDIKNDKLLIDLLKQNYKKVFFWPQGSKDMDYIQQISDLDGIELVGGNLHAYNALLEDTSIELDYIGTRLHGGIRALQQFRRTIIIVIDNRAREKANDFNLNVIERTDIENSLVTLINSAFSTKININIENINIWKRQFQEKSSEII